MKKAIYQLFEDIKEHHIFYNHDSRLVGGTALSYHIEHRISEDLDFFILDKLPKENIEKSINYNEVLYGIDIFEYKFYSNSILNFIP